MTGWTNMEKPGFVFCEFSVVCTVVNGVIFAESI